MRKCHYRFEGIFILSEEMMNILQNSGVQICPPTSSGYIHLYDRGIKYCILGSRYLFVYMYETYMKYLEDIVKVKW